MLWNNSKANLWYPYVQKKKKEKLKLFTQEENQPLLWLFDHSTAYRSRAAGIKCQEQTDNIWSL